MALAGFLVGGAFHFGDWLRPITTSPCSNQPAWNYTTGLDIAFLVLMAVLAWRFITTGGIRDAAGSRAPAFTRRNCNTGGEMDQPYRDRPRLRNERRSLLAAGDAEVEVTPF